ncbi:unnamed protein product, partial [Gongylonema pulchrum]
MNGGAFEGMTERVEVHGHSANWNSHFSFSCRIAVDPSTGVLEKCACRISLRKFFYFVYSLNIAWEMLSFSDLQEQKGGKSFSKLGFVDINLAQFAASG